MALSGLTLVATACSTTPTPLLRASTPDIYLHSTHPPRSLARCLAERLPNSRQKDREEASDVFAGGQRWLITLSADGDGSRLAAHKGAGGEEIEPEVRFSIARCAL